MDLMYGRDSYVNEEQIEAKPASSFKGFNRYTRKSGNSWRRVKHSIKLDMTSMRLIISSRLETEHGFTSIRND